MGKVGGWFRGLAAVAAFAVAGGPAAAAVAPEVWITMDRGDAERVGRSLGRAGRAAALAVEQDGAVVVARVREDDMPLLAQAVHEELRRCGGFIAHASRDEALRAAARDRTAAPPVPAVAYTIDNGPVVQALMAGIQEPNIRATINSLSNNFTTRYHTSTWGQTQSPLFIRDLWAGYAAGRPDVSIQTYSHPPSVTPQPSIVLTIHGTTFPTEVVVLGAHQDSIHSPTPTTNRAPGADDDGSGVATLSEVIRVALANGYRPQRTVKFMAYAAEEVGLRGSNDIAQRFKDANVNVVGAFQLDMTNFKGTPASDIVLITDHTTSTQNTFLGQLVDTYVSLPRASSQCGYACSDHASWEDRGYVSSFPFEAVFGQHLGSIHTEGDTLTAAGGTANHSVKFAKLAAAYMAELAKGGFDPAPNAPPAVSAGSDASGALFSTLSLTGQAIDTRGPGRLVWEWLQISGPPVTIASANRRVASVTFGTAGTYVFRVVVNDGTGSGTDDVTITVTP